MKKAAVVLSIIALLSTAAFAIDGASGLGAGASKFEAGYTGGGNTLAYNFGLTQDLTAFASISGAGSITGIGAGVKYAVFNERKGDAVSLSPKVSLLLGNGSAFPAPGLVVSKKMNKDMTVLGDFWTFSTGPYDNFMWFGGGAVYNINDHFQVAGELGIATYSLAYLSYRSSLSGIGFGIGLNYLL